MSTDSPSVVEIGEALLSRATHHDHGDGWKYTRDIGDLVHIRYRSDFQGRQSIGKRVRRAFDWKHLTGRDSFSRMFKDLKRHRVLAALAWIRVSLSTDKHLPDGRVGPLLTTWEEDGEYVEMVGPTIGENIAAFLIAQPENPHAIAIADEIRRIVWRDREGES